MRWGIGTVFNPGRISGQLALLIVISVVASHVVLTGFFMLRRPNGESSGRAVMDRAVTIFRLLDSSPEPSDRATLIDTASRTFPELRVAIVPPTAREAAGDLGPSFGPGDFARRYRVRTVDTFAAPTHAVRIEGTLGDGTLVQATVPGPPERPPELSAFIVGTLAAVAISLAVLLLWAARVLTSPLTKFADVAERFSLEGDPLLLPETGPDEIRTASRAFNRMGARIRRMMADRTRMLASVSHDLRTPITRLRLRAEFIGDETARAAILRDLDQMNAMVHGALSYLRDGRVAGEAGKLDLAALLRTVADEFCDLGHQVIYHGPDRQIVTGRADEIGRAVSNLLENAVKYGERSDIRLAVLPGAVEVEVADDGPGIPEDQREALTKPFARGDEARNMNGSVGFGLGLSIVRSVAEEHGGRLALCGRDPHGLVARLTLPMAPG